MNQWTKLTTSILTIILYVTVNIGFWFFSPPTLAAEKSMVTEISNYENPRSELVASISVAGFMRFTDKIPGQSEIQSMIESGIKSSSKYVTRSARKFLKKHLPSQEQILDGINDALAKTDVAKKLVSDTTSSISASLSPQKLADDLDQLVSHTSRYEKKLRKLATDNVPEKLRGSKELMTLVFKNIASQKLDPRAIESAAYFLQATSDTVCQAYRDYQNGIDNSNWVALEKGAGAAFGPIITISQTINHAAAAGAGNLTGYAGMAAAVSDLGLGGVMTTLASALGSSATGAAATSVVTSAVGGPAAMTAILTAVPAVGTGVLTLGAYKSGLFIADKLGEWAETTCAAM